ncbi:unannotated protein [freshwater metagenome]|uniref:Unannotated protein n=1 Tax=freshwater metagenome TaxID=449393 RepID=A0A6J7C8K3_9ZZZZ
MLVEQLALDLGFEVTARNVHRAGQRTFVVLIGFAHIEDERTLGDVLGRNCGVDFGDLRLGGGQEVAEGGHARKATSSVRNRHGVQRRTAAAAHC